MLEKQLWVFLQNKDYSTCPIISESTVEMGNLIETVFFCQLITNASRKCKYRQEARHVLFDVGHI